MTWHTLVPHYGPSQICWWHFVVEYTFGEAIRGSAARPPQCNVRQLHCFIQSFGKSWGIGFTGLMSIHLWSVRGLEIYLSISILDPWISSITLACQEPWCVRWIKCSLEKAMEVYMLEHHFRNSVIDWEALTSHQSSSLRMCQSLTRQSSNAHHAHDGTGYNLSIALPYHDTQKLVHCTISYNLLWLIVWYVASLLEYRVYTLSLLQSYAPFSRSHARMMGPAITIQTSSSLPSQFLLLCSNKAVFDLSCVIRNIRCKQVL
jgi:hypothetical protein